MRPHELEGGDREVPQIPLIPFVIRILKQMIYLIDNMHFAQLINKK